MKRRTGLSTFEYLLVLIGLTAAAAAAAYFLYLRPPPVREAGREVAVQKAAPVPQPQPRITHRLTPEEQKAREMAAVLSESPESPDSRPPAPVATPSPGTDAGRPGQDKPPASQDVSPAPPSEPEPVTSAAKSEEPESPPAESPQTDSPPKAPAEKEPGPTPVVSTPPPPEPAAQTPTPEKEVRPSKAQTVWAINVLSTLDEDRALHLLGALMKDSYHVYSYQKEIKGRNWYRIRVGFFDSRAQAEQVGLELARKHQLPPPWIVKPGPSEIHRYYQAK